MTGFVLDASVTLSWAFDDESSGYARAILEAFSHCYAVVPSLWVFEVSNALVLAERRGWLTPTDSNRFIHLVQQLPVEVVELGPENFTDITAPARSTGLTAYDASYALLAMRRGLPLATLDTRLIEAARALGLALAFETDGREDR